MSSILKVDQIQERTVGAGVSISGTIAPDGIRLANLSTSERNALTSSEGDIIYNTDTNVIEFYNGTSWAGIDTLLTLVDEDDMASNSASSVPSQQSVKAYVDANSGASLGLVIALS
jgi:hypothetical protein